MKKIMVVDDNKDLRKLIKRILDNEGFETILAENTDDCLETLNNLSEKPRLILLDIMMPGSPVSEIIKKTENIKIVYLSAVGISEEEKKEMLSQKNVVDFISKPFERNQLIEKINQFVGDKHG